LILVGYDFIAFLKSRHFVPEVPMLLFLMSRHGVPDIPNAVPEVPKPVPNIPTAIVRASRRQANRAKSEA